AGKCDEQAQAYEFVDSEPIDNEAEENAADGDASPIDSYPKSGSFFLDASTFGQDGKAPLPDSHFQPGVDEEKNDLQPHGRVAQGVRHARWRSLLLFAFGFIFLSRLVPFPPRDGEEQREREENRSDG